MDASTGIISGTPNDVDLFAFSPMKLIVSAKDVVGRRAQKSVSLSVVAASGHVGKELNLDLSIAFQKVAVQTSGSNDVWTYSFGSPSDLGLVIDTATGVIEGMPSQSLGDASQPVQISVVGSNTAVGDLFFRFNLFVEPKETEDMLPVVIVGPPAYLGQTFRFELVGTLFEDDWSAFELSTPVLGSGFQVDADTGLPAASLAPPSPASTPSIFLHAFIIPQVCLVVCPR
jgi:hypothetical protein